MPNPTNPPHSNLPDRSHIDTEQRNQNSTNLDSLTPSQIAELINREDHATISAVTAALNHITSFLNHIEQPFCTHQGRLIYIGAGTSGRLGVLDASEAPPTFCIGPDRFIGIIAGGDRALRQSSEGLEDISSGASPDLQTLSLTSNDTVLGIAAGGTTPYVLGALQIAKSLAPLATTALLTCANILKPPHCDFLIPVITGPEILTGSTRLKAGTATKMVLNIISTTLMVRSNRTYSNLMVDLRATNAKLLDRAARVVQTITKCSRPQALDALNASQGSAKLAIVMIAKSLDHDAAAKLLAANQGNLRKVIGEDPAKLP
jgi:N-acetylmuramic acid 6-phosphate etherase